MILVDVSWRTFAACGPENADWFWLDRRHRGPIPLTVENRLALRLCRSCPVMAECDAYEAEHPQPFPRIADGKVISPSASSCSPTHLALERAA